MILAFSVGLTRAATGLVSRALGSGDRGGAARCASQLVFASAAAGIAIAAAGIPAAGPVARALGADPVQAGMTVRYMAWLYAFAALFIVTMAVSGVLVAHGNTRTYRNALAASAVLNMALDPVLMFGWLGLPALGIDGIAIATVATQAMVLAWLLVVARRTGVAGRPSLAALAPDRSVQKEVAAQAFPPTLNMLSISLGFLIYVYYLGQIDVLSVAAFGIAQRVDQVVQLLASGFGTALLALAGQNFGAGLHRRMKEAMASADRHVLAVTAAGGLLMIVAGKGMMWLFSRESAVISYGYAFMVTAAFVGPAHALLHNCVSMLQAVGRPLLIVPLSLLRMVVLPSVLCWALVAVAGLGTLGVWIAFLASNLVAAAAARLLTVGVLREVAPLKT